MGANCEDSQKIDYLRKFDFFYEENSMKFINVIIQGVLYDKWSDMTNG